MLALGSITAPRLHEVFERALVNGNTGDSQRASDLIASKFPDRSPFQEQLVLTSDSYSVDDPRFQRAARDLTAAVERTGLVTNITSYFSTGDRSFVSADARTTYATLDLRSRTHADGMAVAEELLQVVAKTPRPPWLAASVTGIEAAHADVIAASQQSVALAERIGLPVAMVVLVVVFGALVAAALPLLLGALSIVVGFALTFLVGQWIATRTWSSTRRAPIAATRARSAAAAT